MSLTPEISRHSFRKEKGSTVQKPQDEVGSVLWNLQSAKRDVEEINSAQDLKQAMHDAEMAAEARESLRRDIKKSGGIGMSVETIWRPKKKTEVSRAGVEEEMRQYHAITASRAETVANLKDRLKNLLARKSELRFWDFKMRGVLNEEIAKTEAALVIRRKEEAKKAVSEAIGTLLPKKGEVSVVEPGLEDQLLVKQLELTSLSAINPFNWPRRSRLDSEISDLKKQIARQKIAGSLSLKEKK